jgi:hypothetical protein
MSTSEKILFIDDILSAISKHIAEDIERGRVPEEWDGIELRWLVVEKVGQSCNIGKAQNKRRRAFNNTVIVNNL